MEKPLRRPSTKSILEVKSEKKPAVKTEKAATGQVNHGHRPEVKPEQKANVKTKMMIEVKTDSDSNYSVSEVVAEPLAPKQGQLLEQQTEQQTKSREKLER